MAKVITSKSGKVYIQLDDAELDATERTQLAHVLECRAAEKAAMQALRETVLARDDFFDKGLTVYVDWGKIKVTAAGEERQVKAKRPTLSLADALKAAELDGFAS